MIVEPRPGGRAPATVPRPGRFAAVALLWAAGIIALVSVAPGTPARVTSHTIWLILSTLATAATWHRSNLEPAGRRGWRFIAVGLFLAASYSATQLAHVTLGTPAPDLVIVVLTMAPYPLGVLGILFWPSAHRRLRVRAVIDAGIFAGSMFFLFWATGLGDLVRTSNLGTVEIVLNLAWFGGATLVLGIVAYVGGRSLPQLYGPPGYIGLGVLISMVCALISARLTLTGSHFLAHPIELLWLATPLCFLLAALSPEPVIGAPAAEGDPTSFAGDLITYLPAVGVLVRSLLFGASHDPVLVVLGLAIGGSVILRQFIALHDGRLLSRGLERKVQERSRQLEASQAALVRAERMQAMGQVSGGIAHDFRNVLQSIVSQVEVLQLDIPAGEPRTRLDGSAKATETGTAR